MCSSDLPEHPGTHGTGDERFDGFDQGITGVDVHTGLPVGERRCAGLAHIRLRAREVYGRATPTGCKP